MATPIVVPKEARPVDPRTHQPVPPPPRDWGTAPPGEAFLHGLAHVVPDYFQSMYGAGKNLATQHPVSARQFAEASQPDLTLTRHLLNLANQATGAGAPQLSTRTGIGDIVRAAPTAIPNALSAANDYLYRTYTAPGALQRTWATHPAQPIMDAQTALAALEGGEGFLAARAPAIERTMARVPGAVPVSRAVGATARGAGTVGRVTNPAYLATKTGANVINRARTAGKIPVLDATTGGFSPQARAVIQQTFPNLSDEALADPKLQNALTTAFNTKGVNSAAAREGMLQYHGAPTPRGPITQQRPVGPTVEPTNTAVAEGKTQIAGKGDAMAGASAPDPTNLGATVRKASADSAANASGLYTKADTQPGGVISGPGSSDFVGRLRRNMTLGLQDAGFSPTAMANLPGLAATNTAAGNLLDAAKNFASAGSVSFPELEQLRRYGLGQDVPGMGRVDSTAARAMRQAFDQTVQDHIEAGHVTPDTLADAATNYSDARAAYAQHQATFVDPKTANPVIRKAIGVPDPGSDATFVGADDVSAQNAVNSNLFQGSGKNLKFHPNAQQTYNAVADLGPDAKAAMDDHIRQTILGSDNGLLTEQPDTVRGLVNSPVGSSVFSPDENLEIQRLTAGADVLNPTYPKGMLPPKLAGLVAPVVRNVATGLGTYAATQLLPPGMHHMMGDVLPTVMGMTAEARAEPWFAERAGAQALEGAPMPTDRLRLASDLAQAGQTGSRLVPPLTTLNQMNPPPAPAPTETKPGEAPTNIPDWDPNEAPPPSSETPKPIVVPKGAVPVAGPNAPDPAQPQYVPPPPQPDWDPNAPEPKEERAEHAAGGRVIDMTERLMKRAEQAQKAAQSSTKPLLGLSDDTVAQALRVAQRGL